MPETGSGPAPAGHAGKADRATDAGRHNALLKTGALQNAILTSANFSIIATDEKGVIQLFNVGGAHAGLHGRRSREQDQPERYS
jgi:hypothetical protein